MQIKCNEECPGDDTCEYADTCMCGSEIKYHGLESGHSPVSMHDYYAEEIRSHEELVAHGR